MVESGGCEARCPRIESVLAPFSMTCVTLGKLLVFFVSHSPFLQKVSNTTHSLLRINGLEAVKQTPGNSKCSVNVN